MNQLRLKFEPYNDDEVICFSIFASSGGFSGLAEILQSKSSFKQFGVGLIDFPKSVDHTVLLEYGDGSDEWPYHVVLRAQVMDGVGHSAIFVRIQSFCSPFEAALSEFLIPSEPASINELGQLITDWPSKADEPLVWQP